MDKLASKYPKLKKAKQKFLSKFDKMLSMVVVPPAMAGILDAMGYGNELEAYGRGIRKGLQGTVTDLADFGYNLIAHPIDSRVGLAKTVAIAVSYSPNSLLVGGQDKVLSSMDKALGTDLLEQKNAMEASLKSEAKDMANTAIHGTSTEKAELAGRITEFVAEFFVGTKGVTKATKAGKAVNAASRAKKLTNATKGLVKVKIYKIESLLKGGTIGYNDILNFAKNKNLTNKFTPTKKFPNGFKYEWSDGKYNYEMHGHGSNPKFFGKPNNAANPTISIRRTSNTSPKVTEYYMTYGKWGPFNGNENASHIPLKNSPYK